MAADDSFSDFDDEEMDEFLHEWAAADKEAAGLLSDACAELLVAPAPPQAMAAAASSLRGGVDAGGFPYDYFVNACDWGHTPPTDDEVLLLQAVKSTIAPVNDPGTDSEEQAAVASLLHADWFGMVVGLVRRGVGAHFDGPAAIRDIEQTPEITDTSDDPEGDVAALAMATTVLSPLWQASGVLDTDERLTEAGRWILVNALYQVWAGDAEDAT